MKIGLIIKVAFWAMLPLVLLGGCLQQVFVQHHKLTTYQPVPATMLDVTLENVGTERRLVTTPKGKGKGTRTRVQRRSTATASVRYEYEVAGLSYTGDTVTPLNEGTAEERWRKATSYCAVGGTCTAHYNPRNPGHSFLIREYSDDPYLLAMILLPVFGGTTWLALHFLRYGYRPRALRPNTDGWIELQPWLSLRARLCIGLYVVTVWNGTLFFTVGHYFSFVPLMYFLAGVNLVVGVILALAAWQGSPTFTQRPSLARRSASDPGPYTRGSRRTVIHQRCTDP